MSGLSHVSPTAPVGTLPDPAIQDAGLRFLLAAGRTLASSLDYEETLATVARLAVPHVADWAGVDLWVGGAIQRLAVAHVDPAKVELARELHRRFPPHLDAPVGLPRVLRTGEAELVEEIPDSLLVSAARDEEELRIARELGLCSYMVVPLVARGEVLGAISFVSAESGRRYGPADLSLAQELASAFTEATTIAGVGEVVMRHGVAAQDAAAGVLALVVPGGEELEIVASVGYPPAACMGPGRRWPLAARMPIAEATRTGEPVFVESPRKWSERYLDGYARPGSSSAAWAAVPVTRAGSTCGALLWTYTEPREFGAAECALMLAVARLCSQALERARLYEAERQARAEAEEANRSKSEFLGTMSHELRTPLNAIGGYVDLLEMGIRGPVTEEQRSDLARIKRSQQVLLSLINDVLNYARLEAGKLEMARAEVPVVELLDGLEPLIAPQVRARELAYACDPGEAGLAVVGDPERIRQILLNLLSNAIKFTEPGGRVEVSARADEERAHVHVRDTGRGIPADRLESVFDPFVQIDRHRTEASQQGVGLGLAISRELARGMGGDLAAESTPGEGSTFTLTLPLAR